MQLRQMEIVTDKDKLNVDIQQTISKYQTIKQYAYILHDKDDTRPHYHIYINFGSTSCDTKLVANWFDIGENFISRVKGRKADVLLYLTHGNDSQKNKHQYLPSEVISNFDFESEIELTKIIGNFERYSYAEQLLYINTLPVSEKAKAFKQLNDLWRIECQCLTMNANRNIEVVFITGSSGFCKTSYAKKMLEKLGYDYCISSSSNDPFQDYLGQKAIILDDLRDTAFQFEDLLKIIDNNTSSSVKSRFNNKVLNCKMIIITSSVPLKYWYAIYRTNPYNNLEQLYRRINCYVKLTENNIVVYDGLDKFGNTCGVGAVFENEFRRLYRETLKKETTNFVDLFSSIVPKQEQQLITASAEEQLAIEGIFEK